MEDSKRCVIVSPVLTGHMYYMSPYETYDSCGNCDGARCDRCKTLYEVQDFDFDLHRLYDTKELAEKIRDKCKEVDTEEAVKIIMGGPYTSKAG